MSYKGSSILFTSADGNSKIKDLVVKFNPDPPKTGNALSITITGELGKFCVLNLCLQLLL